jgi:hypothetical protein
MIPIEPQLPAFYQPERARPIRIEALSKEETRKLLREGQRLLREAQKRETRP